MPKLAGGELSGSWTTPRGRVRSRLEALGSPGLTATFVGYLTVGNGWRFAPGRPMLTGMADADPRSEGPLETEPVRSFGWWDMWVRPEDDPRTGEELTGERDTLVAYLRDRRLTLEMKCSGLDAAGMARRSVPPSDLSLLGLVRHLADTERYWFREVMAGQAGPWHYRTEAEPDAAFTRAAPDPEVVAQAWGCWRGEVEFAERLVAQTPDLGVRPPAGEGFISMREVLVHMIEEYARHNGHADFLRERIDGRIGQ